METLHSDTGGESKEHQPDAVRWQMLGGETEQHSPASSQMRDQASGGPPYDRSLARPAVKALGFAALLAILFVTGRPIWNYLHSYESTDDAEIDGHIVPVASRINGTILQVHVEETQTVKAGQLLASIDPRDEQVAVENARANLSLAQAQAGSAHADYQAALAKLHQSEATLVKARRDAERYTALLNQEVIAREQYEEKIRVADVDAAAAESDRAAAQSAQKVIASREASVHAAQAQLDQALLNLSYTKIMAPFSGVIGKKTVEVGQRVQPGEQLMAIVGLDDIWVTANFKETQVRRMRRGEQTTIHVDALERDFDGYVEGMAGATGEVFSLLPPENATGNYVKVVQRLPIRIRFNTGQDIAHALRPGLSVEPKVWLR
ncbi:MAG: HlyD family secretion protein [Deltaproteobacteria bacterium]|nr:HlyD family secretion protein [Deltaproteobacteria bacterium]